MLQDLVKYRIPSRATAKHGLTTPDREKSDLNRAGTSARQRIGQFVKFCQRDPELIAEPPAYLMYVKL